MSRPAHVSPWRYNSVTIVAGVVAAILVGRALDLQVLNKERYQIKGDAAHLRVVETPVHRGMITDRNGEPLAISTPVASIWVKPADALGAPQLLPALAKLLGTDTERLISKLEARRDKDFVYLKRRVHPELASAIERLSVPGINTQREYRRYYPTAEVTAHVLGFTDVDDRGQEGIERVFDHHLQGQSGSKKVLQDRRGRIIAEVAQIADSNEGQNLSLTLDKRIQYLAYRALKSAVQSHDAVSGSMVVLDTQTGEVLAMVNQPSYNPNSRHGSNPRVYRNRAVTDVFEPGSTVKPFIVAAALESGRYNAGSVVETAPGRFYVGRHAISDVRDYGRIDVTGVLTKSSNVGIAKLSLGLEKDVVWNSLARVGFGVVTGSNFPGEQGGYLKDFHEWVPFEHAATSYGYGLSSTALQLARAYTVLANDGELKPVSLLPVQGPVRGTQVMRSQTARSVRQMLETVVAQQGTAPLAAVAGYRVAGKTGTVKKLKNGAYTDDEYIATFAGIVPASRPRFAAVVVIDQPQRGIYYGGQVAAPVFSEVMRDALRLLDVPPDDLQRKSISSDVDGKHAALASPRTRGAL